MNLPLKVQDLQKNHPNPIYIIFDTETTGIIKNMFAPPSCSSAYPYIVQLAWMLVEENKSKEHCYLIQPKGYNIPKESTNIHGISHSDAEEKGIEKKKVLELFWNDVKKADYLLSHHADFDSKIIAAECYRVSIDNFLSTQKIYCTMKSTTQLCQLPGPYGYKYPKLKELYSYLFRIPFTGTFHHALDDCRAIFSCWKKIQERYPNLPLIQGYEK